MISLSRYFLIAFMFVVMTLVSSKEVYYHKGEKVDIKVSRLLKSPFVTDIINYNDIPLWAYHQRITDSGTQLTETKGDLLPTPFKIEFLKNLNCTYLVSRTFQRRESYYLVERIKKGYFVTLIVDEVRNVLTFGEESELSTIGFPIGGKFNGPATEKPRHFVNNHLRFVFWYTKYDVGELENTLEVLYGVAKEDRKYNIVGFEVQPMSLQHEHRGARVSTPSHYELTTCTDGVDRYISPENKMALDGYHEREVFSDGDEMPTEFFETLEVFFTYDVQWKEKFDSKPTQTVRKDVPCDPSVVDADTIVEETINVRPPFLMMIFLSFVYMLFTGVKRCSKTEKTRTSSKLITKKGVV